MERALLIAVVLAVLASTAEAQQVYREDFEGPRPAWRALRSDAPYRVLDQSRSTQAAHSGRQSERIAIEGGVGGSYVYFAYALGRAEVIEELVCSLWVQASRPGVQLLAEVTLPRTLDPQTGQPLTTLLRGDISARAGQWQRLELKQPLLALERQQRILRASLRQKGQAGDVEIREAYLSRLVLNVYTGPGRSEVAIDDLQVGPFVGELPQSSAPPEAARERPLNARASLPKSVAVRPQVKVEMRQGRLFLNNIPALPRIIDAAGVPADVLKEAGFTTIALPWPLRPLELEDAARHNFWFFAALPNNAGGNSRAVSEEVVAAVREYPHSNQVLIWNLGTQLPGKISAATVNLSRRIPQADPAPGRPLAVDITDNQRTYARMNFMLGVRRAELATDHSLDNYRDWLYLQRNVSPPDTLFYTWVPLQAPFWYERVLAAASAARTPPPPEPEQIRLLTYTVLSAGYHALGYRGDAGLARPEGRERLLAVQLLNMETQLLEPLIANAKDAEMIDPPVVPPQPVKVKPDHTVVPQSPRGHFASALPTDSQPLAPAVTEASTVQPEVRSALIAGDHGLLVVLPVWYSPNAQFVPPQMAANNLKLTIRGVPETAQAWEVSLGEVHSIHRERVPGGTEVTIPEFDTTSIVIFTTDTDMVRDLQYAVGQLRPKAGQLMWELAAAKYARVEAVFQKLTALRHAESDGAELLRLAREDTLSSKRALDGGDPKLAIGEAQRALRALRVLESTHWQTATKDLTTPLATPYSLSYFTLPEFYQFMERIRGVAFEPAGLLGGNFEDAATLARAGWSQEMPPLGKGIKSSAAITVSGQGHNQSRSLHLTAISETGQPIVERTSVALTSPKLPVQAGDVVRISFWLRVPQALPRGSDGGFFSDSIGGPGMAVHFDAPCLWRRIEVFRTVGNARSISVTLGLSGLGEIYYDDLKIDRLSRRGELARGLDSAGTAR